MLSIPFYNLSKNKTTTKTLSEVMSILIWLLRHGLAYLDDYSGGWPGWALPALLGLGGDLWTPASLSRC